MWGMKQMALFSVVWTEKGQLALQERALCQRDPDHEILVLASIA